MTKKRCGEPGCVYMARNTVNGKCYVGKTVNSMRSRRAWHQATAKRGQGWCFHRALRKYGSEAFVWTVLFESNDPEELCRKEQEYIAGLKTKRPGGYNLTDGGDGVNGRDPESQARIVAFHTGRKRSAETRRRLSIAMTGKRNRLGIPCSEETKGKLSAAISGRKSSEEVRAKIGAALAGRPKTPEQRAKMSEARRLWWARRKAQAMLTQKEQA